MDSSPHGLVLVLTNDMDENDGILLARMVIESVTVRLRTLQPQEPSNPLRITSSEVHFTYVLMQVFPHECYC
jgi:hypothetical protein